MLGKYDISPAPALKKALVRLSEVLLVVIRSTLIKQRSAIPNEFTGD